MPLPRQSSISSAACCSTLSGRTAGPAEKLNGRLIVVLATLAIFDTVIIPGNVAVLDLVAVLDATLDPSAVLGVHIQHIAFGNPLHTGQPAAIVHADQRHALGGTTHFADLRHTGTYQHTAIGDEH